MKSAEHQQQVRECAAEIGAALPSLADRHTPLILIAALTEQVSGALCIGRHEHVCSDQEVKDIIERVRELAFSATDAGRETGKG
jgi:hypothetical protein